MSQASGATSARNKSNTKTKITGGKSASPTKTTANRTEVVENETPKTKKRN